MTHGSLFSGIGGFDLAAEWMGWENMFHCEWNPFGQKILKHYWPDATSYGDITKTDFTIWRGRIDVLTGGFPCQPYSSAGKRKGKDDNRHLWPEMLRAIREIQPRWIVGENVRGLTNWNGGLVFDEVQADLETESYEVLPFLLPACGIGAPHRRDRIWFIAYSASFNATGTRRLPDNRHKGNKTENWKRFWDKSECNDEVQFITNSEPTGRERSNRMEATIGFKHNTWDNFPKTEPAICAGNDGIPTELDGITFSKWRNESIKGAGNAIVPQVALQIFKTIQQYENTIGKGD